MVVVVGLGVFQRFYRTRSHDLRVSSGKFHGFEDLPFSVQQQEEGEWHVYLYIDRGGVSWRSVFVTEKNKHSNCDSKRCSCSITSRGVFVLYQRNE